ncbi:hypothetical protein ABW21_db0202327 [Orbilia brochopaga]|nr:hypothetical protein ABW21_db0202327 [Drechslerella brochopaga]
MAVAAKITALAEDISTRWKAYADSKKSKRHVKLRRVTYGIEELIDCLEIFVCGPDSHFFITESKALENAIKDCGFEVQTLRHRASNIIQRLEGKTVLSEEREFSRVARDAERHSLEPEVVQLLHSIEKCQDLLPSALATVQT